MLYNRRQFLNASSKVLLASSVMPSSLIQAKSYESIKAIAFDAFPIFDPRPIFGLVKIMYPKHGTQFSVLWRTRIFEYTWLLTSAGRYQDFLTCIENALIYTAKYLKLNLTDDNRKVLINAFFEIKAFPDVEPVLSSFKSSGIKLAFLSNMSEIMLKTGIKNSGLEGYFDHILSTDQVQKFKPSPEAYQMAVDAFRLPKNKITFAAFASWDVTGSKWFGYKTYWVNRLSFISENLGDEADDSGSSLNDFKKFIYKHNN
jgi:2-haloacid dehalogenase